MTMSQEPENPEMENPETEIEPRNGPQPGDADASADEGPNPA